MRIFTPLLGALALILALSFGTARAQGFLSAYEDLPLPPGMTEVTESGLSFDMPNGRIVEAFARGPLRVADIIAFYAATLPQLGWTRDSDRQYRREAEVLTLETQTEGRNAVVHFTIAPE